MSAGDLVVRTSGLSRSFGELVAVRSVDLEVRRGEIFGLLGPNGAGKSTTVRMLCGILTPSGGSGSVLDYDISTQPELIKQNIGYMTQRFSLYEDLTVEENLWFYGGIYGLPRNARRQHVEKAIERGGLEQRRDQIAGTLSGGWKQRVALSCATLHEPSLLFLDEPTAGVDPVSRRHFWTLIHALASDGTTILVTTHYMDEAERCHRLAFIFKGSVFATGTPQQILRESGLTVFEVDVPSKVEQAVEALSGVEAVDQMSPFGDSVRVALRGEGGGALIEKTLKAAGIEPDELRPVRASIDDAYVSLVRMQEEPGA